MTHAWSTSVFLGAHPLITPDTPPPAGGPSVMMADPGSVGAPSAMYWAPMVVTAPSMAKVVLPGGTPGSQSGIGAAWTAYPPKPTDTLVYALYAGVTYVKDGPGGDDIDWISLDGNAVLRSGDTMTGSLLLSTGSAPAPALAFSGSPGTGIYRSAADQLALATAGTQRMTMGSTGIATFFGDVSVSKAQPGIYLEKQAGNTASLYGRVSGQTRWGLALGNAGAESGSNAGSDFVVSRFSDTGVFLGDPLTIRRSSGLATFGGDVILAKAGPQLLLDKTASGQNANLVGRKGGLTRWILSLGDDGAETGSDRGSDFRITCHNDAGSNLGSALIINRHDASLFIGGDCTVAGTVTAYGTPVDYDHLATVEYVLDHMLVDAPADGTQYGRKNAAWTAIPASVGIGGGTMTGPLLLPDGSASAPALGFSGHAGAGLYYDHAGDYLALGNGGNRAMVAYPDGSTEFLQFPWLPDGDPPGDNYAVPKAYVDERAWQEAPIDGTAYLRQDAAWIGIDPYMGGYISGFWNYNNSTTGNPGSQQFTMNSTTLMAVTVLKLNYITANTISVKNLLLTFIEPDHRLYIQNSQNTAQYVVLRVTGPVVDNTSYCTIPVVAMSAGSAFAPGSKFYLAGYGVEQADTDARYVNTAGDTMTGTLTLAGDPVNLMDAATKQFVLANAAGLTDAPNDGTLYGRKSLAWARGVAVVGDTMTGALTLPAGAAGAPSLAVGQADVGLARLAANTLSLATPGGEQVRIANVASAVNYIQLSGAPTANGVQIIPAGTDANVDLQVRAKGSGSVRIQANSAEAFRISNPTSAVNYFQVTGAVTGASPSIAMTGSDTDIALNLNGKGAGVVRLAAHASNYIMVQGGATSGAQPIMFAEGAGTDIQFAYAAKGTGAHRFYTGGSAAMTEQLRVAHTASAVNYLQATGATAGSGPALSAQGTDTNADIQVRSKGTGSVRLLTNGTVEQARVTHVASAVNYVSLAGSITGSAVEVAPGGSDTNTGLTLSGKGTGLVTLRSNVGAVVQANGVASAANFFSLTNAAAGASPQIAMSGSDTNISLLLIPKGSGVVSVTGALQLPAVDPTGTNDATRKDYVDRTPVSRASVQSAAWASTDYGPGTADEVFFQMTLPTNTRHLFGNIHARAAAPGGAGTATGIYSVRVYNGASALLYSADVARLTTNATILAIANTGGPFAAQFGAGAITSGSTVKFYVRNPDAATAGHNVQQYTAAIHCVTS